MVEIGPGIGQRKTELIEFFRARLAARWPAGGSSDPKEIAKAANVAATEEFQLLRSRIVEVSTRESWPSASTVAALLAAHYSSSVVMVEARNRAWPYDYMSFSRRMGELWQPFCLLCFEHPSTSFEQTSPPAFTEVRQDHENELRRYLATLSVSEDQREHLLRHYRQVWELLGSGEVSLQLDLHFSFGGAPYAVDFKSAFGSNEKGNTNRLLLVASVYRMMHPPHSCLLWVRAEEGNNAYFRTLERSALWHVTRGAETYREIERYSGFDLRGWIDANVDWLADLDTVTADHLVRNDLGRYARW